MESTKRVIMVDDNKALVKFTANLLRDRGFDVMCFNDFQSADKFFRSVTIDVHAVLLDYAIGAKKGSAIAATIKAKRPDCFIIMISGCSPKEQVCIEDLLRKGVVDVFVEKPFAFSTIEHHLKDRLSV
jgi:FixJ family two-component response regulator